MYSVLREFNNTLGQIAGAYHDYAARLGIADSVLDILYGILNEGDGCNQSLLYKNSGLGRSTVNSAIRKMEREGLLTLTPGEGRNTRVFLTGKGRELAESTAGRLMELETEIFRSWTREERALYFSLFRRYLRQFRERTKE